MSEQLGLVPGSPDTGLPLRLSSAIVAPVAGGLEPDRALPELSISACVLGGIEIMLAATDHSREGAADSAEQIPASEGRELRVNSILLSSLPGVIHLTGRSSDSGRDGAVPRSYRLTLTFSDGSPTTHSWSTTFEVPPRSADPNWHLTVPFDHALGRVTEGLA